jgi:hypothetical protein
MEQIATAIYHGNDCCTVEEEIGSSAEDKFIAATGVVTMSSECFSFTHVAFSKIISRTELPHTAMITTQFSTHGPY